jgi:hypothetical protein
MTEIEREAEVGAQKIEAVIEADLLALQGKIEVLIEELIEVIEEKAGVEEAGAKVEEVQEEVEIEEIIEVEAAWNMNHMEQDVMVVLHLLDLLLNL